MRSVTKWRLWNHSGKDYVFVICPGGACDFHDTAILVGRPGAGVGDRECR